MDAETSFHRHGLLVEKTGNWRVRWGVTYTLPLLLICHGGKVRFQLERDDIPLTPHLSISTNYDNDLRWGVGLMLTY